MWSDHLIDTAVPCVTIKGSLVKGYLLHTYSWKHPELNHRSPVHAQVFYSQYNTTAMSDTVDFVLPVYHTQEDDPRKEISCTLEYGYDKQSSAGEIEDTQSVKKSEIQTMRGS